MKMTYAFLLLVSAGAGFAADPAKTPSVQRIVQQGIAVELSVEPLTGTAPKAGDFARVRLRVSDASGASVTGLSPGVWLDRTARGEDMAATCKPKVESFLGGSFLSRPTLDLNTYYALAMNEDASITVVDPLFGFGSSQLLAMVFLDSPGEDWALAPGGERLFVSLPDSGAVAAVETRTWKVIANVKTGPHPRRLGLPPGGRYLWVGHDGEPGRPAGVTAIDVRTLKVAAEIATGAGPHGLVWSADSRYVFVANEGAGTVSVLDTDRLPARAGEAKVADLTLAAGKPARLTSIAYSTEARMAYVVDAASGVISTISAGAAGAAPAVVARIAVEPGAGALRFAPGGRLGFLLHPAKNRLSILDAATNRIVQSTQVEAEPDQVTFTENLAYVRHQGSDTVLMIPLAEVGKEGRLVPLVDFPGGQHPPGKTPRPTPADGIVRAPGGPAVLVANPLDKAIYFYKEGMAAPMGQFQDYGHNPRAVLVLDRSLREVAPGTYETTAKLGDAGAYTVALYVDSPKLLHCFPLEVAADPALAARLQPFKIALEIAPRTVLPGQEVTLDVRVTDTATGAAQNGLTDLRVLTFLSPGSWQQRHEASALGEGRYEVRFKPPEAGLYYVFVEVPSTGMTFSRSPATTFLVGAAPVATSDPAVKKGGKD
jgi:YVTN family beta-propeller protein